MLKQLVEKMHQTIGKQDILLATGIFIILYVLISILKEHYWGKPVDKLIVQMKRAGNRKEIEELANEIADKIFKYKYCCVEKYVMMIYVYFLIVFIYDKDIDWHNMAALKYFFMVVSVFFVVFFVVVFFIPVLKKLSDYEKNPVSVRIKAINLAITSIITFVIAFAMLNFIIYFWLPEEFAIDDIFFVGFDFLYYAFSCTITYSSSCIEAVGPIAKTLQMAYVMIVYFYVANNILALIQMKEPQSKDGVYEKYIQDYENSKKRRC